MELDLVEILRNCPKGIKLYSTVHGEVILEDVVESGTDYPIKTDHPWGKTEFARNGKYYNEYDGECVLFPSKDQRDWSKFERFWDKPKIKRFDPKTLKEFDNVLVRDSYGDTWKWRLFSHIVKHEKFPCMCVGRHAFVYCIPYNDETKHLLGTCDIPDEKYIWWE